MPLTEGSRIFAAREADSRVCDVRVSLLLVALISSGCTTTSVTQRTALGVIPATPATLAGTSGMALTSRFMPSAPIPEKSTATATPYFQPELSGVVRVGKHFAV